MVLVFESNLAGDHSRGSARFASCNYGAIAGQGVGIQGRSYAIPTRDEQQRPLGIDVLAAYIADFLAFARIRKDLDFEITPIGSGLFAATNIAPLFAGAPGNCHLPQEYRALLADPAPSRACA